MNNIATVPQSIADTDTDNRSDDPFADDEPVSLTVDSLGRTFRQQGKYIVEVPTEEQAERSAQALNKIFKPRASLFPDVPLTTEQAQAKEIETLRARVAALEQDRSARVTVDTLRDIVANGSLLYYLLGPAGDAERKEWAERVQGVAAWMRDYERDERVSRERWEGKEG